MWSIALMTDRENDNLLDRALFHPQRRIKYPDILFLDIKHSFSDFKKACVVSCALVTPTQLQLVR